MDNRGSIPGRGREGTFLFGIGGTFPGGKVDRA
jgi:hypothetical protein